MGVLTGTATGLFDLSDLNDGHDVEFYWLAEPRTLIRYNTDECKFVQANDYCYRYETNGGTRGFRPVVCLTSNVILEDTDGDGVLEIK